MNPSRKYPAKERRYGFACLVCRRRKIRCDGKKPNCENCAKAKETCNYKESSSYNAQLVSQLQRSRKHNNDLKRRLRELASLDPSDRDRRLAETNQELDDLDMMESPPEGMNEAPNPNLPPESDVLNEEMSYHVPDNFSLDENGTYYGATSRFCPLPASEQQMNQHYGLEERKLEASEAYHRKWLASNSKLHQSLENLAMKNIHQYTDVDPDLCEILLQIYWTWQAPLHNCVYRRCFFRDLALGGPYFSPFLLNVMFAHACRHTKDDDTRFFPLNKGEYFLQQARQLLMEELARDTPRICTIQGLLILGGRQCAVGKSSEGWLYTGMAIRMMTDLGIHLYRGNLDKLHGMEPHDLEVRKRLYLSAFIWDK
ncbi:hypothetical protein N7456_006625 [Penicillium angulare]|uniref:Zn(2)-C6 fungal-type domain-containing protein n=1 Tax=Penicillium angulare TaxID=116970 RepID=A0A9W9KC36_9EURO|nr:hypothetical protein N7456_006625 [Penicillium angulare]